MDNKITSENNATGNLHKPLVMRSVTDIQARIDEIKSQIQNWTNEYKKSRDEGYKRYCEELLSVFQGELNSLQWVVGQ